MKNNIKKNLPNAITLVNLSLGVIAILLSVSDSGDMNFLFYASLFVMVAALTDRLDGKVARMLGASSELGKELDSLSDLISFGVAPVIIAWKISFMNLLGIPGYILVIIFPIAGAYRLARYNVTEFNNVFTGMPITIAGAFLAIANLYNIYSIQHDKYSSINPLVTAFLIILLSYFMVSRISIKKR